jgi:hypothetical protein
MHVIVGVVCLAGLVVLLAEFFTVFLLPRRGRRDPALARGILRLLWVPWRAAAGVLPRAAADTTLGIFGPLGLLAILAMLSAGVILCFSGLHWAVSTHLGSSHPADFGDDLYFSAGTFTSATNPFTPAGGVGKTMQIVEAGTGLGLLAIAIGYLPALFQAFSRRETAVARLGPRAGSPPSPGRLLERSGQRGGWTDLDEYLLEWETWTADLMQTHLAYPILGYFRSQHFNQNWLAALTTIVDASAYALAYGSDSHTEAAELTFRIGGHALGDLAHTFSARRLERDPEPRSHERLSRDDVTELRSRLEGSGLHSEVDEEACVQRLEDLRASYEPYAIAIARHLALELPDWLPKGEARDTWPTAEHPIRRATRSKL